MVRMILLSLASMLGISVVNADESKLIVLPDAFKTLVNPPCSHCRDEAKRRANDLKEKDRVLCWIRGYSDGGAIPYRFFLNPYRVISDSYGVFVHDPDAGFSRGFPASYEFRFHGWRNGIMVMKHQDGTLFSTLSGVAFDGPRKGMRLKPVPTLVSDWGYWLTHYPDAVAYHMFDQYQPVEMPKSENPDSIKSRIKADPRLKEAEMVLGVWTGKAAIAYPQSQLEKEQLIIDEVDGKKLYLFWEAKTKTASAYRGIASQPRKYKAPEPNEKGISPANPGIPLPKEEGEKPTQAVTLKFAPESSPAKYQDEETKSFWDIAGRCVEGKLKGWTLEWVDSVQVKWFAWAAEYPTTSIYQVTNKSTNSDGMDPNKKVKEISGTAEFLRLLPKPFATLQSIDLKERKVTLLIDGQSEAKTYPLEADVEIKRDGWWGRLEQFQANERVWVWLKLNRKKEPISVVMLADTLSEFDMHGHLQPTKQEAKPKFSDDTIETKRKAQRLWLRQHWEKQGLPGTLQFSHVFSGEIEIALDHEAMRWARALQPGAPLSIQVDPPIKAVVREIRPWRERTVLRLVVGELESSELKIGQRLHVLVPPLDEAIDFANYPTDIDRTRTIHERLDWFLASTYCTCGVSNDICTGHFYTLSSCNPNGCGMPNFRRDAIRKEIENGKSDREIFDSLLKEHGNLLIRPHLKP